MAASNVKGLHPVEHLIGALAVCSLPPHTHTQTSTSAPIEPQKVQPFIVPAHGAEVVAIGAETCQALLGNKKVTSCSSVWSSTFYTAAASACQLPVQHALTDLVVDIAT